MTPAVAKAATLAPAHPSLRWTPQWRPDVRAQHRRHSDGDRTMCGVVATLVLAESDDPFCEQGCYPAATA